MSVFGRGVGRPPIGIALGIAAAWLVAGAWAAKPATAGVVPSAGAQDAAAFWTPARMRQAKPIDALVPGSREIREEGRRRPEAGAARVYPPSAPGGAGLSGATFETVADPTVVGARRHGVVFIQTPFGLGRCSGTSVNAPNFSVVVTAAHCIHTGGRGGEWLDFRWVFVPGYRYGQRPFGVFPARWIDTTLRWRATGSENYDVGAAVVARNAKGALLAKAVGGAGIAWGLKPRQVFDVHGYPAQAPFDGETQHVCTQTPFLGHDARSFLAPGPLNLAAACAVTGGASGGGWTIREGVLNSVTSYGYADDPATDFGPYFGREVGRLVTRARRVP